MEELTAKVIPLALIAAISPTVFLATVVILSGRRSLPRAWTFVAGVATAALAVAIAGFVLLGKVVVGRNSELSGVIDLVVGILLLAGAAVTALRRAKTTAERPQPQGSVRYGELYLAGVGLMATNFSSIMPLLVVTKDIAAAHVAAWGKAALFVAVVLIVLLPALLPVLLTVTLPNRAAGLLDRLHKFLERWGKWVVVAVFGVISAYLVIHGIIDTL